MEIVLRNSRLYSPLFRMIIEDRLRFALRRFSHMVRRVEFCLTDLNGPKGGVDKRCRVRLITSEGKELFLEGSGSDSYSVVSNVLDRVRVLVSKARSKQRQMRRKRAQYFATENEI